MAVTTLTPLIAPPTTEVGPWGQWRSDARVELLLDGRHISMAAPLIFVDRDGVVHVIRTGFVSDGASIPRWLWSLVGGPLSGRYRRAALLHDWLYHLIREGIISMSWWTADRLFEDAMRADGVPAAKAFAFRHAVTARRWA
jgi:hypothetical protein